MKVVIQLSGMTAEERYFNPANVEIWSIDRKWVLIHTKDGLQHRFHTNNIIALEDFLVDKMLVLTDEDPVGTEILRQLSIVEPVEEEEPTPGKADSSSGGTGPAPSHRSTS